MAGERGVKIAYYQDFLDTIKPWGYESVFSFLCTEHWVNNLSVYEIADKVKRSATGIRNLFDRFGISRRRIHPETVFVGNPCSICGGTLRFKSNGRCRACALKKKDKRDECKHNIFERRRNNSSQNSRR